MEQLTKILSYSGTILLVINAIGYSIGYSRFRGAYRVFTFYLLAVAVVQILMTAHVMMHMTNLYLSNVYLIVQFVLLSLFYSILLNSKVIKIISTVLTLFVIGQYVVDWSLIDRYNSLGITITQVVIIVYSVIYFYRSISKKSIFIIVNIGVFLYLICSTLIFASGNLHYELPESGYMLLLQLNTTFYLVFQILVFIEWFKNYNVFKKVDN